LNDFFYGVHVRLIFAGTPDFAAAHLQALLSSKQHDIVAVYTQPDRPAGRGNKLMPSAVKTLALEHKIPVEQPVSLKTPEALAKLMSFKADLMVVVAYGLILPREILDSPKFGCINVHGSLLPKWRGAAPIQRAIWAGDSHTGVCIMQMDEGLDTGAVLLKKSLPIDAHDTSADVYSKLASLGPKALLETLEHFDALSPVAQDDSQASYAKKLSKAEAKCDWSLDNIQLERNVRAFNPWPVVWFEHQRQPVKVWQAIAVNVHHKYPLGSVVNYSDEGLDIACSKGVLRVTKLQLAGKKAQNVKDLIHGKSDLFTVGELL
jgi:methionyl-tRNA formyltransferase